MIEARAEAVQGISDALEAAKSQYQRREVDGDVVADRLKELAQQRRAFLAAIGDYNFEIAEYALATALETATPATLVPMLIKSKATAPETPPTRPNSDTKPTTPAEH